MVSENPVDVVTLSPDQLLVLIVRAEKHKQLVWTAGRVLKEAALWKRVRQLDYEERKKVLKGIASQLQALASQGILQRRVERQSIGYGNEIGFDYVGDDSRRT
jgi:hypothetical protein